MATTRVRAQLLRATCLAVTVTVTVTETVHRVMTMATPAPATATITRDGRRQLSATTSAPVMLSLSQSKTVLSLGAWTPVEAVVASQMHLPNPQRGHRLPLNLQQQQQLVPVLHTAKT